MPGKLPIDRVRENEDAPAVYELEKERLTQQHARRRARWTPGVPPEASRRGVSPERAAGGVGEDQPPQQEAEHA
jgi:hypothetical protein